MKSSGGRDSKRAKKQMKMKDKSTGFNYLCQLPEVILLYILSLLPTRDHMALSLVSKHWKRKMLNYVSEVPSSLRLIESESIKQYILDRIPNPIPEFYGSHFHGHLKAAAQRKYINYVTRTLMLHTGFVIENLNISFRFNGNERHIEEIQSWVEFSFTNKIRVLSLDFSSENFMTDFTLAERFDMPSCGFSPCMLESMALTHCTFNSSTFGPMICLHKLKLKKVEIYDCCFRDIVRECPVLKEVIMERCIFPPHFMVCEEDLKIKLLTIIGCGTIYQPAFEIDISAPELESLLIRTRFFIPSRIKNAKKLKEASIEVNWDHANNGHGSSLASLLDCLSHCKTISLTSWCIQVLPTGQHMLEQLPNPLTHVEHLKMRTGFKRQEMPGLACLIRSCPNLKTISFIHEKPDIVLWDDIEFEELVEEIYNIDMSGFWETQQLPFPCLAFTVKRIIFHGFRFKVRQMEMAKFFIRNAFFLKDMDLYYNDREYISHEETEEELSTKWVKVKDHALSRAARLSFDVQVSCYLPSPLFEILSSN